MKDEIIEIIIEDYKKIQQCEQMYFEAYVRNTYDDLSKSYRHDWQMKLAVKDYLQNLLERIMKNEK